MSDPSGQFDADRSSRARDHLANERTYLAWLRTAATVMVLGLAVAEFAETDSLRAELAGAILLVVGAAGVVYGGLRYRRINRELEDGRFLTGSLSREPLVAGLALLVAVVAAFVVLLL